MIRSPKLSVLRFYLFDGQLRFRSASSRYILLFSCVTSFCTGVTDIQVSLYCTLLAFKAL